MRLPDELADETAVLTDSLASALQPVLDHLPPDEALVVVYGAGIIGQHTIRLLRHLNCQAKIIAVVRYPFQQTLAQAGGADVVLVKPSRRELGERRSRPGGCPPPWGAEISRAARTTFLIVPADNRPYRTAWCFCAAGEPT